jgi:hypothetical protein
VAIQPSDKPKREPQQSAPPEPDERETDPPYASEEARLRLAAATVPPSERTIRNARRRTIE